MNKLVRNNIPDIIKSNGKKPYYHKLSKEDLKIQIKSKLVEESNEVNSTDNNDDLIKELADVQEVIQSIKTLYNISDKEIEIYQDSKRNEVGGFDKGYYLTNVE